MLLRDLAESCVYTYDKTGRQRPNPAAFGAGGYECYSPDDLVAIIEDALRKAQQIMMEVVRPGKYRRTSDNVMFRVLGEANAFCELKSGPFVIMTLLLGDIPMFVMTRLEFVSAIDSGGLVYDSPN